MFLISLPDLKSLVAQMVNLHITHNVSSNIALTFKYCLELLNIFKMNCELHPALSPEWQKNKNACLVGLTFGKVYIL